MKICCISDTHRTYPSIPRCDLLIHAGDHEIKSPSDVAQFDAWCGELLKKEVKDAIFYIPGNHDKYVDQNTVFVNAHCLVDKSFSINGITIYGVGNLMNSLKKTDWDRVHFLVCHYPPVGILDSKKGKSYGLPEVNELVKKVSPQVFVFGHVHGTQGTIMEQGILFLNVTVLDEVANSLWPMVVEYHGPDQMPSCF